jgi:hypothetical protein
MIPTNMTAINEHNEEFKKIEEKENKDLESMVGDISSGSSEGGDMFDRELSAAGKDDNKPLKDTLLDTYKDTAAALGQDVNPVKEEKHVNKFMKNITA